MPVRFPAPWIIVPLLLAACQPAPGPPAPVPGPTAPRAEGKLPPVPLVRGPISLRVVYPQPTDLVDAGDSTFLFGSAGTGEAALTVNGFPVRVWPNGAWLAWVPIPPDSILTFHLVARTAADSASLEYSVRRAPRFLPPGTPVWIDSTSLSPRGPVWWPADEYLPVSVRATPGATVRLVQPGGRAVLLAPDRGPAEIPWGVRAFDRDTFNLAVPSRADRYLGALRGVALADPITVEAVMGLDTARVAWPLQIELLDSSPRVVEFNDDTAGRGDTDSLTIGRARPGAAYHWFLPTGTRAVVTGRLGNDLRVRLSQNQEIWVPASDAVPLPPGTPDLRATVGSLTLTPEPDRLVVRVPLSRRVPFRVEEGTRRLTLRLYHAAADIDWIRYGPAFPYLRSVRWLQTASDEVALDLEFTGPVWGYRARWSRNDLLLEVRRPPRIDPHRPLRGRLIVVDPGHPPLGATGPTGLREAEANLAVAEELGRLLEAGGARVLFTRRDDSPLDLLPRVKFADSVGAELLVSVHNNALPDGVNPFTNNGSSVFYNHPRSLPLARAIQRELVRWLGVRDLGVGWGDLALARPTWMPAVLTEGLFMMIPEQEAALRDPAGRRRYAAAVASGIARFLRDVARGQVAGVP
ncbi:MAG TPA: N-acetylmuramoyl-L-alanine amidase [Gemmatimonadales bacterium]|nr:N-acetylmuramoyl-L-alanine amidase [Gemmatimonadales bacterium]